MAFDPRSTVTGGPSSPNPRTSPQVYNPYNVPSSGYGEGSDPYGSTGSASSLAGATAESNLSAVPDMAKLSSLINQLNAAQQTALNASRLGPQGQQIQSNLLGNLSRQSAGLLDPQTEAMLQQGIAAGGAGAGFGVDSGNLASAYRRALGQTIEGTEAAAGKQYIDLLAANPSAPLYRAEEQVVTPSQYSATAAAQAQRQLEQERMAQQAYEFEQQQENARKALAAKTGAGMGYNVQGQYVPGGEYGYGYYDVMGRFHPGGRPTGVGGLG